jgi:hypothetical protein
MSKNPATETGDSREELVTRFLEQSPDYFLRHPELLAALAIPHSDAGRAVSLVERQVKVLRDRNESMARELKELLGIARDNDLLGERVQRFALAMLESATLDEALDTAQDMLRQEFNLDGVAVRLTGNPKPPHPRPEFVSGEHELLNRLLICLSERNHQPLCGALPDGISAAELFGEAGHEIRSIAALPLTRRGLHGVLVLGSREGQRFRADMGTVYLVRLGELLMAALTRYLVTAGE